jgi:hypothetical protein
MAAFARPASVTNDELEMYEAPSSSCSFALLGEKPSHHQTPSDFVPALDRKTAHDFVA